MNLRALAPSLLQRLIWPGTRALFASFLRLRIEGVERLEAVKGGCILAVNHGSELDPVLVAAAIPFFSRHLPLFYVSGEKKNYREKFGIRGRLLYGGKFFKAWGAYPAFSGLGSYAEALRYHLPLLKRGATVCIFPSGTLAEDGVPKAKGGVAYLARATGLPIIPVRVIGAAGMRAREFFAGSRRARVIFGTPLYADDIFARPAALAASYTQEECEAAAASVMRAVYALG